MTKIKERRSLRRFNIPGSIVLYKKEKGIKLLQRYSSSPNLVNLTKSGLCIQIKNGINSGDRLKVHLEFPGDGKIEVKGRVRWKNTANEKFNEIGIQFEPFGEGKKFNSVECLEKLREISEQYLH